MPINLPNFPGAFHGLPSNAYATPSFIQAMLVWSSIRPQTKSGAVHVNPSVQYIVRRGAVISGSLLLHRSVRGGL